MRFSHVFVARPKKEAGELAAMIEPLGLQTVVQPAFDFEAIDVAEEQPELLDRLSGDGPSPLLIFTSTRAVEFGLPQLPTGLALKAPLAAIGPATSRALEAAGFRPTVRPSSGYTSEALLQVLKEEHPALAGANQSAVILAAPGGRRKMEEGLAGLNWSVQKLLVYRRVNARLEKQELEKLLQAKSVLAVWTSANAMQSLSQRLPPATWFKLCRGEWLVISERLVRLARAYDPSEVHLSSGPGNHELFTAIRGLI